MRVVVRRIGGRRMLERVPVVWKHCRVGKAKRAHQAPQPGGHGAQERAFAHPTSDSSRSKSALVRGAAIVALAFDVAACGSVQNMMPDPANFRLPDRSVFLPTNSNSYAHPVSASGPVGPADLVDGQGQCAGAAPAASDAASASPRGVSLEMTECEVVRALGQPQTVEITPQSGGQRSVVMKYTTGERAGIYQFVRGRLTAIERGNEPPPPAVAKKPPAKKPRPPA